MTSTVDINIPNIEQELNRLWKGLKEKKLSKASLFTLIIYAHEPRRAQYLQDLVHTILEKFPCRIIFIEGEDTDRQYFHVSVSTVVSGANSDPQNAKVACDQITIAASKNQLFRVPFLITPNLVPDLPVYLLWGQNPFEENVIFPHLQPIADRVIFDSECSDNLSLFCQEMKDNLGVLSIDVMDINWAIVSNWRDMLFQLFDTKEKIEELKEIKSIVINYHHNATETVQHPEIRAIYLQGWLAASLGWRYRATEVFENNIIISYFGPNTPVVIALAPQKCDNLPPGGIASLEITLTNGHSYSIARKPNISQVIVHASTKDECKLPYTIPLPNVHRGLNFIKEIFFSKLGTHYRQMLDIISLIDYKTLSK